MVNLNHNSKNVKKREKENRTVVQRSVNKINPDLYNKEGSLWGGVPEKCSVEIAIYESDASALKA